MANHQSKLDVLALFAAMSLKQYVALLPIHFLIAAKYMDTWWKKLCLGGCGVYAVGQDHKGLSLALLRMLDHLEQKRTILLFPEGKIVASEEKVRANPGIGYLIIKKSTTIMPIYLSGFKEVTIGSFLFRRHQAVIVFGLPQKYGSVGYKPQSLADQIMMDIYGLKNALYVKNKS